MHRAREIRVERAKTEELSDNEERREGTTRIYEIAISATSFIAPGPIYLVTRPRKLILFLIPLDFLSTDNLKDPLQNLISECILERGKRKEYMYIMHYVLKKKSGNFKKRDNNDKKRNMKIL